MAAHTIGEMAHVRGENPGSNRYDAQQDPKDRDDYSNLILLCPTHHTQIDKPENESHYTVELLTSMKAAHEENIRRRLDAKLFNNKYQVAIHIFPLMKENHEIFVTFGPNSEVARHNPESDAHEVWLSERLSRIVPNNRSMMSVVEENIGVFAPEEQEIVKRYCLHVRTYERWVRDEITYEAVVRFPLEFESLITGFANART